MYDFIASLLAWLYDFWPSYGGAILLLTLIIMIVLAPFTIRQTRSMLAMQDLQPEVKRLRQKYGNDRERMNQEMMALYQANGVNPLGGCLPLLIQAPIFLVLFQVVRGLTRRESEVGLALGDAVERLPGVDVSEFGARLFNPAYVDTSSSLYQDLSVSTEMRSFGLDLSQSASDALGDSIVGGIPYLLLVIGVGVTTWLQQKQIQGRSAATMNPQQQMLMKVLPFMLPVFSFGFPAALVVYWFVSNLFRVGQQVFITKRVYGSRGDEVAIVRPDEKKKKDSSDATKGSGSKTTKNTKTTKTSTETDSQDTTTRKGTSGTNHGRRSPVSGPPPKKRKKPPAAKRPTDADAARTRDRQERPTSKRVTPKKNAPAPAPEPESSTGSSWLRRDRKKT